MPEELTASGITVVTQAAWDTFVAGDWFGGTSCAARPISNTPTGSCADGYAVTGFRGTDPEADEPAVVPVNPPR